jgi:putative peptide zinc metalloprotease protein
MSTASGGPSFPDGPPVSSASPDLATAAAGTGTRPPREPARAGGVQLIGEAKGSGYREAPFLVRRADGQTIQLTRLLYLALEAVDGTRNEEDIAQYASTRYGKLVSADNVRTLIDGQLLPLGLLRLADGSEPAVRKSDPLLGMRFRYTVTDPERTRKLTAPFAALFHPLIVAVIVAAFLASCWWVLMVKGLASATHDAFANPGLLLLIFAITILSAGFHEFGHAAAARRGGATPGAMGAGLYLVWPAFYTDVTDSYRLGRAGRLRTDLGGLYFNAITAVTIMGIWWVSGYDALLLVVVTQILQMVRQLLPLLRFDGYHILADATGVPDLFQRIKPTLLGLLPWNWRKPEPEAQVLKPWAKAVITAWVLVTVPLLLASLVLMVVALPRLLATAWASLQEQQAQLANGMADGNFADAAVRVLAIMAVVLPLLGIGYMLVRLVRQLAGGLWQKTSGRPLHRGTAMAAVVAVLAGLAWAWWPSPDTYRPVQPYERGTLFDATAAINPAAPGGLSGPALQEGRGGQTVALWPEGTELPTRDKPQLSMVLVPRQSAVTDAGQTRTGDTTQGGAGDGTAVAPSWVFPFDKPPAPEEDGNQALAVNTTDGSVTYDVAFALVWAEDGPVDTTNEAYAFASCSDCAAVAVGFQVVLIIGQADIIVPENLSAAANYNCVRCLTYALASQLVLTLDGPLSTDGMTRLSQLWEEIAEFGRTLQGVPLSEIQGRLEAYKQQIMDIIRTDPSASPATGAGPAPTGGSGQTQPPSGAVTSDPTPAPAGPDPVEPAPAETPAGTAPPPAPAAPAPVDPVPTEEPAAPPTPEPTSAGTAPAGTARAPESLEPAP